MHHRPKEKGQTMAYARHNGKKAFIALILDDLKLSNFQFQVKD